MCPSNSIKTIFIQIYHPIQIYHITLLTNLKPNLKSRTNAVPAGRFLSNSSAINDFAFLPNSSSCVEAWATLGNPGWDEEVFFPNPWNDLL